MNKTKQALVLGLGVSGRAAARLLQRRGVKVFVVDDREDVDMQQHAAEICDQGGRVCLGPGALPDERFELAVVSPGVPADASWMRELASRNVPVIAELELGWRHVATPILAVTGSNGKSTCAKLCAEALTRAGLRVTIAGNYGTPLCDVVDARETWDWIVVEVSSFQLEGVREFRPDIGILLNVHANHLDRHGDAAVYTAIKSRLFANMRGEDTGIVYAPALPVIQSLTAGQCQWISFDGAADADVCYREGAIAFPGGSVSMADTIFDNPIMGATAAASVAAIRASGQPAEVVADAARDFKPLPHRMQPVAEIDGVRFVDDSKATNLMAMGAALRMLRGPIRLIAGGVLKEHDLAGVKKLLAGKVAGVYLIGAAKDALEAAWNDSVPCRVCRHLADAVQRAWDEAKEGEVILLSPACASFDQFASFEERGDEFAKLAQGLRHNKKRE
jgi:UDP-N-acetylmuramoylalanine--D-glutamate ligase